MIFEFRDFVLILFTLREDTDLQNYSVRLIQMKKKYDNLLYGCDELLAFVLDYIKEKYGIEKKPEKEWTVSVKNVKGTIASVLPKFRKTLLEIFNEKSENENKINEEKNFDNFSTLQIANLVLLKKPEHKLAKVTKELVEFQEKPSSEVLDLRNAPIIMKLMRFEMSRDKEQVRMSKEFKIFREMTEKSILRTIFFYHKRESSPFEWKKYDPGALDYRWTGSQNSDSYKAIFEEELEDNPEENEIQEELKEEMTNGDNKLKIKFVKNETNGESEGGMKIVLKPIGGKGLTFSENIFPEKKEESETKFKISFKKGKELFAKKEEDNNLKIEEKETVPLGKGLANFEPAV